MQERKSYKILTIILMLFVMSCIPTVLAAESTAGMPSVRDCHPYLFRHSTYSWPYATQDHQNISPSPTIYPPIPTPVPETTGFLQADRNLNLIKFLQNSSHLSQGNMQQSPVIVPNTSQIPVSTPTVISMLQKNPVIKQAGYVNKLPTIQTPASQTFIKNTKTPIFPSFQIPQESDNNEEILRAYERNLTKSQLKLSTALLILTDPAYPFDRQSDIWQGTYGALVVTGTLIPANQLGSDGSNGGDIILVSIYLNQGSSIDSVDNYLYQKIGYDEFYNSVVAWVRLNDIAKLSEIDDVRLIDNPVAPINYHN